MKTKLTYTLLFGFLSIGSLFAQNVTTVRAANSDISDNLNLQAVSSIFGDSRDLEDFERRLNDPDMMISNLDLNGDNRVDYLRVVELAERSTHVIVLQAVLGPDTFQDVATIEVERDRYNNVTVQVVGDPYIYGPNYIYEPVYVTRPVLFGLFWVSSYRPYYSPWYWDYYPTYYNYWTPCAPYRYHNHVNVYINYRNTYNYVNTRYSSRAMAIYSPRRSNGYERMYPGRSFEARNNNVRNHYELQQNRNNLAGGRNGNPRFNSNGVRNTGDNGGRAFSGNGRENGTRSINQGGRNFNNGATTMPNRNNNDLQGGGRSFNNGAAVNGRSNNDFQGGGRSFNGNNNPSFGTPSRGISNPRPNINNQSSGFGNGRGNYGGNRSEVSSPAPSRQYSNPGRSFDNGGGNQPIVRPQQSPRFDNPEPRNNAGGNGGFQQQPRMQQQAPVRANNNPAPSMPNGGGRGGNMQGGRPGRG